MNKLYEDVTETSGPQLRQKLNNLDNWVICKKKKTKKTDALVSVFLKMYPKIALRYAHAIEIWWLFGNRSINFVKNLAFPSTTMVLYDSIVARSFTSSKATTNSFRRAFGCCCWFGNFLVCKWESITTVSKFHIWMNRDISFEYTQE